MDVTLQKKRSGLEKELHSVLRKLYKSQKIPAHIQDISFRDFLSDKTLIIHVINEGVPYSLFYQIQQHTPLTEKDWANLLEISTKSLQRYKSNLSIFKSLHSEKILEMAEVTALGVEVFGNMEKFKLWLDTPNYALGNVRPFELLHSSYGKEMVTGELTRISYGILS